MKCTRCGGCMIWEQPYSFMAQWRCMNCGRYIHLPFDAIGWKIQKDAQRRNAKDQADRLFRPPVPV